MVEFEAAAILASSRCQSVATKEYPALFVSMAMNRVRACPP
jgi:hypothetical protein